MNKFFIRTFLSDLYHIVFAMVVLTTVIGCGPPRRYAMDSDQLSFNNSGIVLGRVTKQRFYGLFMYNADGGGRGIGIKNKSTGEEFTYIGAHYFEMRLPEGTYQLTGMGTPNGAIIPRTEPFEFSITNGEIKYIGSIVADRDLMRHFKKRGIETPVFGEHVFSIKDYGEMEVEGLLLTPTGRAREPFFTFYIIDEHDEVIDRFKKEYPDVDVTNLVIDFMK